MRTISETEDSPWTFSTLSCGPNHLSKLGSQSKREHGRKHRIRARLQESEKVEAGPHESTEVFLGVNDGRSIVQTQSTSCQQDM